MTDPRPESRALCASWLQVRVHVRALSQRLAAAQHRHAVDLRRGCDPAVAAVLCDQLAMQRAELDALATHLDARIAAVRAQCTELDACYVDELVRTARRDRGTDGAGSAGRVPSP